MATVITLPKIIGLDKEQCVPKGNQRLWNYFGVEGYSVKHSKIFEPYLFMPTNKSNLPYQKMVDRYQFLTSDGVKPQCAPLCQEGWYFDCETETCKEFDFYPSIAGSEIMVLPISAYDLWESLPIGNGLDVASISEGWGYKDYGGELVDFITKTVSITKTGSTKYRPANTPNPFKTAQQLVGDHMEDFRTVPAIWFADMKLYDWPNAIIDDYSSVEFYANKPFDGSDWYRSGPIKVCYKYSFANLPARYVGQEHELAISILRSKYGFRI